MSKKKAVVHSIKEMEQDGSSQNDVSSERFSTALDTIDSVKKAFGYLGLSVCYVGDAFQLGDDLEMGILYISELLQHKLEEASQTLREYGNSLNS